MGHDGEAIPRHLVFVLETGEIVVQRGANLVELLESHERRVFADYERERAVTSDELRDLRDREIIGDFDDMTIWLPRSNASRELQYYFLDTHLAPPYLPVVVSLLQSVDMNTRYIAKSRMGRIAIMGPTGDPFARLADAESALTLIRRALGDHLPELSIDKIEVDPRADDTQVTRPVRFDNLIRHTPTATVADATILVVADNQEINRSIAPALGMLGVYMRAADTGEAALEILMDEEPDLILITLDLPDMHGYEVIAKIRKDPLTATMPIIAMSPHFSEADVVFALNVAKVDEYLVIPFTPHVLRHTVLTLLNRRL